MSRSVNRYDDLPESAKKMFDYCQELVMLNYIYEKKLISKDIMFKIKMDIEESYKK